MQRRILPHHVERNDLAGLLVGLADGGAFEHAGMLGGNVFDFVGIHLEAGHGDHVLLAVFEKDEAVAVDAADVAGLAASRLAA